MDDTKEYKISAKNAEGKWFNYGNIRKNSYGNMAIGLKVTEELKNLIRAKKDGEWVNLSIFVKEDDRDGQKPRKQAQRPADHDDEIPFAVALALGIGFAATQFFANGGAQWIA